MFTFQGFPMSIVIVLVTVGWLSILSVVLFSWWAVVRAIGKAPLFGAVSIVRGKPVPQWRRSGHQFLQAGDGILFQLTDPFSGHTKTIRQFL